MRLLLLALLTACFFFFRWLSPAGALSGELGAAVAVAEGAPDPAGDDAKIDVIGGFTDEVAILSTAIEGSLSVRLVSAAKGQPIEALKVILEAWEGEPLLASRFQMSASDGRCRFDHLRPGTYDYRIEQAGNPKPWTGHWKIEPGELLIERLDLSQRSNVH